MGAVTSFRYTGDDDELQAFLTRNVNPGVTPDRTPRPGDWLATDGTIVLVYTAEEVCHLHWMIR